MIQLLIEWERWSAEILESHVSYPILCYYRSQHDNQNWLSALVAILDSCALLITIVEGKPVRQAQLTFAMARDNALPFGEKLARVNPKTQTPIIPAVVIGLIAAIILVINIGQPKIFTVLTSIAIIMIYMAYLMVTGPMLKKRFQGQWPPKDLKEGGYFTMGKWGMLVNIVAVVWGVGMALNLAWPRVAVYGDPWYNTWGAFVYIGVILGAGLLWYAVKGRHHIGTLESHAAVAKTDV